jgi:hypothetical protein
MGGEISVDGDRRLVCKYSGTFITALLALPAALLLALACAMAVGAVVNDAPTLYGGTAMGVGASGLIFMLVRHRLRTMGWFLLDRNNGTFTHRRGKKELGRWGLMDVHSFELEKDHFHRGFSAMHWLVARVPDGRSLRLGKGSAADMEPVLALLRSWGLTVGAPT